jgi:hypothetical protein
MLTNLTKTGSMGLLVFDLYYILFFSTFKCFDINIFPSYIGFYGYLGPIHQTDIPIQNFRIIGFIFERTLLSELTNKWLYLKLLSKAILKISLFLVA